MQKQNLLMSIYLFALVLFTGQMALAQSTGTFTVVKGDVQVTSASGTTEKAKVGKKVNPSDIITAGPDSRAKIVMADKNVINISPETKMALEKYVFDPATDNKQVTLNVVYGKVRATVEQKYDGEKNKFHIKTPAAVAGVRGTDFLTSFSAKTRETKIITFEGKVAVGLPGPGGQIINPVFVTPGQMTTATQGRPPMPPQAVPSDEFSKMNTDSQTDPGRNDSTNPDSTPAPKEDVKEESAKNENPKSEDPQKSETAKSEEPRKEGNPDTKGESSPTAKNTESRSDQTPGPGSPEPTKPSQREPASESPSSGTPPPKTGMTGPLLRPEDMAPTSNTPIVPDMPKTPVMAIVPQTVPTPAVTQQYINQVNQVIQNTNTRSKVNIIIRKSP